MEIPKAWRFDPLEPYEINPAEILNTFERAVYDTLGRLKTRYNENFEILPEHELGGFSVDIVVLDGKKYGIECDGVHFHYISHSPSNGMFWEEYLRQLYIEYTLDIPLIRVPSSVWPYSKVRQEQYLRAELQKVAPHLFLD